MWTKSLLVIAFVVALAYFTGVFEGFENPDSRTVHGCPPGYRQCTSGDCVLISDKHAGCPGKSDAY